MIKLSKPLSNESYPKATAPDYIVQVISYALWHATTAMLAVVFSQSAGYFIIKETSAYSFEGMPYLIAALVVLGPLGLLADKYYRHNVDRGAVGTIFSTLSALLAFVGAISGLVTFIFFLINYFVSFTETRTLILGLVSCLCVTAVYGALFFKVTINDLKTLRLIKLFFVGFGLLSLILAMAGPISMVARNRNDSLIRNNLQTVKTAIDNYARSKSKLPASLNDIELDSDNAKKLLSLNLVQYKPVAPDDGPTDVYGPEAAQTAPAHTKLRYELCVTYKSANEASYSYYDSRNKDEYTNYIDSYFHEKGEVCYKLRPGY